jgi:hypothetical protein
LIKLAGRTTRNFSTAALFLTLAATVLPASSYAQAAAAPAVRKTRCAFLDNAPDQHVVVKGDTLWGISGKFLQHPWCWPQVWDMNREQIRNPHWIYPGQIVYFDRVAGRLRLGKPSTGSGDTVRLSPRVRSSELAADAIPTIPPEAIEPFLSRPLIVEADELKDTPRIVATQENHVYLGNGDKAYVRGDLKGHDVFQVFRPGKPLRDPATNEVIGYEAMHLGTVKLVREAKSADEASSFVVTMIKEEMGVGDRLIPQEPTPAMNYAPHAPEKAIDAQIVAVYGGVTQAGQNAVVSINRGARDGIDVGTVLELYRLGQKIKDPTSEKGKELVQLPNEKYGTLFIFRVFNRVSYGLIMEVQDSAQVGDIAATPE